MAIQSTWLRRAVHFFAAAAAILLVCLIATCVFFRISRPRDVTAYIGMAHECHPVWKKLALRQINAGDSTADFLANNSPTSRVEFGRYGVYRFAPGEESGYLSFTGLSVIAHDGKLIHAGAGSCCWDFTFFDDGDPDFNAQYTAYIDEQIALREKKAPKESGSK